MAVIPPEIFCWYLECNIFCCNCDGGCRQPRNPAGISNTFEFVDKNGDGDISPYAPHTEYLTVVLSGSHTLKRLCLNIPSNKWVNIITRMTFHRPFLMVDLPQLARMENSILTRLQPWNLPQEKYTTVTVARVGQRTQSVPMALVQLLAADMEVC